MSQESKYSLWIVPGGDAGRSLQAHVDSLAVEHNAPSFVPHLTVVANILADADSLPAEKQKAAGLAKLLGAFTVTLGQYGYTSEEFRCLYRFADAPELAGMYEAARDTFPQSAGEHFAAMTHLSIMYGTYPSEVKDAAIAVLPSESLKFEVGALALYKTDGGVGDWQFVESYPFGDTGQA